MITFATPIGRLESVTARIADHIANFHPETNQTSRRCHCCRRLRSEESDARIAVRTASAFR